MKTALTALLTICLYLPLMGNDAAKKKFEETKALAEKGDASAQEALGFMYFSGEGVPKSPREAARWYRKAAIQGNAKAQFNLGSMYSKGEGVLEDDKEAAKWYRKAADQGHVMAQYELGVLHLHGKGVKRDAITAFTWLNIAGANGSRIAAEALGKFPERLTNDQISKADALAREMIKKNPKLLK